MNLRDLQYLLALAEEGHFGRAAERCFVSQPTLSAQIKKVEEELGVTLFERSSRRVAVTPVGEEILLCARRVAQEVARMTEIARSHSDPLAGPLRLGAIPTVSPYLMPLILGTIRQFPHMRLILSEETTDVLVSRLKRNEIDAALLGTDEGGESLVSRPLYREPFWVALEVDDPLTTKEEITSSDLAGASLLLLTDGHCLRDQALALCRYAQTEPRPTPVQDVRATSLETLVHLVAAGHGVTLIPALAIRASFIDRRDVAVRPMSGDAASRTVSLAFRRTYPRVAVIDTIAQTILSALPNTVQALEDRLPRSRTGP